ncbi:hypothetical protein [uncultured Roseobacter sp.]|uniref:hypothetical protein n=1 Tax=uncultured Roseobacter sp. TaxID=114847 RepID=UPI00261BE472|nr:hypothetical protein [uncultured Roseobacter sp.]
MAPVFVKRERVAKANVALTRMVMLDKAGHYLIEEPELTQMNDAIPGFVNGLGE